MYSNCYCSPKTFDVFVSCAKLRAITSQLIRHEETRSRTVGFFLFAYADLVQAGVKRGDNSAYDEHIAMPRPQHDIHFNNGALQTVFDANPSHMSLFLSFFLFNQLAIYHLAQCTINKSKRRSKAKDTCTIPSTLNGDVLAPIDQDSKGA